MLIFIRHSIALRASPWVISVPLTKLRRYHLNPLQLLRFNLPHSALSKWILKAVVQKAISFLPYKENINFFFQKYVTKGVELNDTHFGYKLAAARDHIRYYDQYGSATADRSTVLELGTGWYPIVPTMLFLAGFGQIVSVDIRSWMTRDRQLLAINRMLNYYETGQLQAYLPQLREDRLMVLREICAANPETLTAADISARIHLQPLVMDATRLDFADDYFDFICSNNTFEHVYTPVLRGILTEFKRVLKPDGVMSHFIDLSDHFAHLDPSIDIYHFLRYSRRQWQLIDNAIQPQNRLRWRDYVQLYRELDIPIRKEDFLAGDVAAVHAAEIDEEYAGYTAQELAISHGYIIS